MESRLRYNWLLYKNGPGQLGHVAKINQSSVEILSREISLESARAVYFLTRSQFIH